jgi:corrinoid protein of di/trimethylamine methyltransferase
VHLRSNIALLVLSYDESEVHSSRSLQLYHRLPGTTPPFYEVIDHLSFELTEKRVLMTDLNQLKKAIVDGDAKKAVEVTKAALAEGTKPLDLIQKHMIPAMDEVGKLFEEEEYFVPELLLSGRAMRGAFELIKPLLAAQGVQPVGRVVIGTVQGDLHDIGKNLVAAMLEGAGFEVTDLGADVKPEAFVEAVRTKNANIVAFSAMLTVTMPKMHTTIEALKAAGLRDRVKVMIGGAPISQAYCNEIGADAYSDSASAAAALARDIMVGTKVTAQFEEKGERALAGVAAASRGTK